MNQSECFKEVPNLEIDSGDIEFLQSLEQKHIGDLKPVQKKNPDGTLRPVFHHYMDFYLRDANSDYSTHKLFGKIATVFGKSAEYIYRKAHLALVPGALPYHIDERECALTIPFRELKQPITWIDANGLWLDEYYYKNPVLVNTKIKHGCLNNTERRIMFQISFEDTFKELSDLI
jgi:hypothetical protein